MEPTVTVTETVITNETEETEDRWTSILTRLTAIENRLTAQSSENQDGPREANPEVASALLLLQEQIAQLSLSLQTLTERQVAVDEAVQETLTEIEETIAETELTGETETIEVIPEPAVESENQDGRRRRRWLF